MKIFNSLILMSILTALSTTAGVTVAAEQPLKETPAALTASPAPAPPERDAEIAPIEAAATDRPAMTEQELSMMIEGEVRMSLDMRLGSSAPQS